MDKIKEAQWLLYKWMGCFEKRKEETIRKQCELLNDSMDLGITSKPIWTLFYPMVYSGVIDFAGNGYYALTPPIAIEYGDNVYTVNDGFKAPNSYPIGFDFKDKYTIDLDVNIVKPKTLTILRTIPSLKAVIDKWSDANINIKSLVFKDRYNKRGLAEEEEGLKRFFCIPEKNFIKEIPSRFINPEAYNISNCYTRVINNQANGIFDKQQQILKVETFAFPILLYRALMLEGLKLGLFPKINQSTICFYNISHLICHELNRILNNSITEGIVEPPTIDKVPDDNLNSRQNGKNNYSNNDIIIVTQNVGPAEFYKLRYYQTDEIHCNSRELLDFYIDKESPNDVRFKHIDRIIFKSNGNSCIRNVESIEFSNRNSNEGLKDMNVIIRLRKR